MMKKTISLLIPGVALLLGIVMLASFIFAPIAGVEAHTASYIKELTDLKVDYTDYLDGSVVQPLSENIRPDQQISVIVGLDLATVLDAYESSDKTMSLSEFAQTSVVAAGINSRIDARRNTILSALDAQNVTYTLGESYNTLLSGFEVVVKASDYQVLCQSLGEGAYAIVGEEYHVAETQLVENTVNVYTGTGIFDSSSSGYDGTGMVVAVLDTGLDSNHTAFSTDNFTSDKLGLTYDQVAALLQDTKAYELSGGLGVDDVYVNEKVPFGYDYADNDPDVYSTHNNHGTHVSGVIVGKDDTITGVAPNAQIVSMKVFSDVMDTARSSWILSALEDCVVLDVDVINMSLGTACGFGRESEEELLAGVYQKIRDAGISLIVAASNSYSSAYGSEANGNLGLTSNPDTGTVGSPGTYDGAMSVASINGEETPYILHGETIIYFDESNNGAAEENDFFETLLGDADSKTYDYVVIPGVGRSADYTGMDVNGKIVLVRRGDNTFEEKAVIAQKQGAAGIIIYNNVSGDIKMNVGDATLAVCSISQNDGEMLVAAGNGQLSISKSQTSGPFISDFSSWGPGPDLQIKPEITAHGGNILSSVTGGSYDRLSGTSMACPNLAGVVILLRQYVVENFPEIANDNVKVNAMVNGLMMSTADIANNTNGLPYAVRKQGAGLANLLSAINTTAYLSTYDRSGNAMDKPKLELGDDPNRTGVYTMKFDVHNFGTTALSYNIGAYVMTEGVSETKTNAGKTTITEEAYLLSGAVLTVDSVSGGTLADKQLTVNGGATATVQVTITLSDADKDYLNRSFENGMYVEGYITLTAVSGTSVNLSAPYLAFYGDWTVAPLFDLTFYDTNADELDKGLNEEDKLKADAYATRPIGGVSEDYVSYLGSYYFLQDPDDMVVAANENYIALSNQEGTIHSLRFVWAGLLRNAQRIEIVITDDVTGEVIFETVDYDVRKSYGDGGSIYPANIEIEFDTLDYNLQNNSRYTVTLTGYLDYGDGGADTNKKNVFSFPLTVDFKAPTITDVEFYYEYDKTLKKNRLYAKAYIYDNHYAMSAQLGYVGMGVDENDNQVPELKSFEQYMTPIFSQRDSTTAVTFELTDYIYDLKKNSLNDNTFVITCYDYALNYATYEIGLPDDYTDFYFDGLEEGLTLSPNEVYSLEPLVYPNDTWAELLEFTSSRPAVVRVVNNKLVAASSGKATIKVRDPATNKSVTFTVTVLEEGAEGYQRLDKPVADVFTLQGYNTLKAYYQINSEDKLIGDTGDVRFFEGDFFLELYPSETVRLNTKLDAYFPADTTLEFESSNENIVTIDATGAVVAQKEGFASVTVKVIQDGKSTYYSETVSVEVKDPYVTNGASLSHYFGLGGTVQVPADLHLREIASFAFANFEYIPKTEEELAFDDAETSKQWYIGENTITKVVLPEGVEKIGAYAFANLTGLEEIVLPSTLEHIDYGAFYGCVSLEKISFSSTNNLKIINQNAFENCGLKGVLDLSAACVISDYAFAGNRELKGITTSKSLLSIGEYAFAGCKALNEVTIEAAKVKYGPYAFTDCEALTEFYVNASVLPEGMFYQCENLASVSIGPDVNTIGEFAFRETKVASFDVKEGSTAFAPGTASYILSADKATLVAVSAVAEREFNEELVGNNIITVIAPGAFSHNTTINYVNLPNVTVLGDYAFGSMTSLTDVNLGTLAQIGDYAFFETAITNLPGFAADAKIGKYAFAFSKLTSVSLPDGVVVGEGAFSQCKSLESVVLGNDVTLENYAFHMDKDESFTINSYEEDGKRYFYYTFSSPLTSLVIGDNAVVGESAFAGHASLTTVRLGANAKLGRMAFYNCSSLIGIDLSQVTEIGDYAFSGDVYYECLDDAMTVARVSTEGQYVYTYHAAALQSANLAAVTSLGEYAFAYCRDLYSVELPEVITEIPQYAFAGCTALESVNMEHITKIGDYAFIENHSLRVLNLPAVQSIGKYAFVYCESLQNITVETEGVVIGEGALSYCSALTDVDNSKLIGEVGPYAFAHSNITWIDLSGATKIDDFAFLKEEFTGFQVILGNNLVSLGDNPFAMCMLMPLTQEISEEFNGNTYTAEVNTFDLSETVKVIDGALYSKVDTGWELIAYTGSGVGNFRVADGTIRITAYAFAGSDVQMVTMPHTVASIGHKAFYQCENLKTVVFGNYYAPILEEEFDNAYYESFEHVPGTGDFGTYQDWSGNEVQITGMGMLPYYMWNATDGMYNTVFYGANFVDYIGYVDHKLTMIRPVNGTGYDSYTYGCYFGLTLDGAQAADAITLAAIAAIDGLPERVTYEHKAQVEAARAAYAQIATTEQQAQVTNYAKLISAEQRITALTPVEENVVAPVVEEQKNNGWILPVVLGSLVGAAVIALLAWSLILSKKTGASFGKSLAACLGKIGAVCAVAGRAIVKGAKWLWNAIAAFFKKIGKAVSGLFAKKEKKQKTGEASEEVTEEASEEVTEEVTEETSEELPEQTEEAPAEEVTETTGDAE